MSFSGKVLLITGAGSGIGAGAAIHFSQLGASLAIVDRNAEKLEATAQQIALAGSAVAPLQIVADVTTDAERIIDSTVAHFGHLNVLVNCAGIAERSSIEDFSIDSYDRIMNVNVRSLLLLTQLAIKHLKRTKGNVVNMSSVASIIPMPSILPYCMSKAAVSHFIRCTALDLAKKGIRVNAICPGVIETPLFKSFGITDDDMAEFMADLASKAPLQRNGTVRETARAIEYLASDAVSFVTGQCFVLDGGHFLTTA